MDSQSMARIPLNVLVGAHGNSLKYHHNHVNGTGGSRAVVRFSMAVQKIILYKN